MNRRRRALGLAATAVITIVLWRTATGRYILYPFTILATWFHEMGHGLCAVLLGGTFVRLDLFPDGSGLAVHSRPALFARPGNALVAAAGPLGPALAGTLLIFSSLRPRSSRYALVALAALLVVSALAWIHTFFGFAVIALLAVALLLVDLWANDWWRSLALQFIGVQACISVFLQIGYLFTEQVRISGQAVYSDTGQMAAALLLPYWFWAVLLTVITVWLPAWSLSRTLGSLSRRS